MGWSVIRFLAELDPTRIGSSSFSMRLLARLSKMLNRQVFNEDRPSKLRMPRSLANMASCTASPPRRNPTQQILRAVIGRSDISTPHRGMLLDLDSLISF
jgi:hypothetical protein